MNLLYMQILSKNDSRPENQLRSQSRKGRQLSDGK